MDYLHAVLNFLMQLGFWQWLGLILLVKAARPLQLVNSYSTSTSKTKLAKPTEKESS
jgi:hypothetical protein